MKFYMVGRRVKCIEDMEIGKSYSVCGIVGEYQGETCDKVEFINRNEDIRLIIGKTELTDRMNMNGVRVVTKAWNPRPSTILKMMEIRKK